MKDKKTYLIQVGLKALGFDPGILDGDEGKDTRAAYAAWEASLTPAVTGTTIAEKAVAIALGQVGVRETSKNQGPGLEKFWTATSYAAGYANREPYCAAFICWVISEAVKGSTFAFALPKSALAYDFEKWGVANTGKGVSVIAKGAPLKPGDIFTLSAASHVGMVKSVSGSTVTTIEGNTDGSGSREGDGVYQRTRDASGFRKVIRISA